MGTVSNGFLKRLPLLLPLVTILLAAVLGTVFWKLHWLGSAPDYDEILTTTPLRHDLQATGQTVVAAGESEPGILRCDLQAMSCLITNLHYSSLHGAPTWNVYSDNNYAEYAGMLVHPGIGQPSDYFYIDTWSYSPSQCGRGEAEGRVFSEMRLFPERAFTPIRILPLSLHPNHTTAVISELALIFSVLWPTNFFRVLYTGAVALYNMFEFHSSGSFPSDLRILLADPPETVTDLGYSGLLAGLSSKQRVDFLFALPANNYLIKTAAVGLSRRGLVEESEFMRVDWNFTFRTSAYRVFGQRLRQHILASSAKPPTLANVTSGVHEWRQYGMQGSKEVPTVVLALRAASTRTILNVLDLISLLRTRFHFNFEVHRLEDYSLADQLRLIARTDILIAMHGSVFTHLLFMRSGSIAIELFPFGFRKTTYRNIAHLMDVQYLSWQTPRPSSTRFRPDLAKGDRPDEQLSDQARVNWTDIASKNWWRNQDTVVDLVEFERIVDFALKRWRPRRKHLGTVTSGKVDAEQIVPAPQVEDDKLSAARAQEEKYFMYMPWEQFNNQMIGLKCACAIARLLKRTLVLPPVGYRRRHRRGCTNATAEYSSIGDYHASNDQRWMRVFDPLDYEWRPLARYFLSHRLGSLPCRTVPFDAFVGATKRVGRLFKRHLSDSVRVTDHQLAAYYFHVASLEYERLVALPILAPVFLYDAEVYRYLGRYDGIRILCLGTMFWAYTFHQEFEYPLTKFQELMGDPVYAAIATSLVPHPDIQRMAGILQAFLGAESYRAVHWRRADYFQKCLDNGEGSAPVEIMQSCYQSAAYFLKVLRRSDPRAVWFVATNDPTAQLFQTLAYRFYRLRLLTLADLLANLLVSLKQQQQHISSRSREEQDFAKTFLHFADPIEYAMLDQLLCTSAAVFIGNFYSSFTRTIVEMRYLANRTSSFF